MGSNVRPRLGYLRQAARRLGNKILAGARFSGVYESAPAHGADPPDYLNACCVGWTQSGARHLLETFKEMEVRAGRDLCAPRLSPRPLDLDVLLYGDEVVAERDLAIPHPSLAERPFVVLPLAEIAGGWRHPVLGCAIVDLAAGADRTGVKATQLRVER